ncbi:protein-disulfide reductase DsbD domain-containing protein [Noviherbaspirillum sp.]|jgi:thiol:disulfide interchange protein DsbD|uniref:protein-disulfide reductase DsbD N-terminal domain-containing protein n=1 Tax=Noviherbaspirillum sp. TaxID=1926288 RepID=UPI0025E5748A|nr:protein-disulfide reductase DsbD domain-containing protein [Noviherbaspirillum sp.]
MKKRFALYAIAAVSLGAALPAFAQQSPAPGAQKGLSGLFASPKPDELIEPDLAFKLKVAVKGPNALQAELLPAPGYYLYKDKIRFSLKDANGVAISTIRLPPGEMKIDQIFGKTEVYRKAVPVELTLNRSGKANKITLTASYQGCHEKLGVCYPPIEKTINLNLP